MRMRSRVPINPKLASAVVGMLTSVENEPKF